MKILIVDDENISRKILARKLNPVGDCTVCDNSSEALQMFDTAHKQKAPYHLITLDVSMPKMDGRQLLRLIRKKEKTLKLSKEKQVKIIMVTARMNISTIKTCIKLGCSGYLTKPVNKYQLAESLGKIGIELPEKDKKEQETAPQVNIVADIIKRFYSGRIKLPVTPKILQDVKTLKNDKDAGIEQLESILKNDIAISVRLVSAANSALYKGVDKADTLNRALVRLGMKTSCDLVTTIAAKELFDSENQKIKAVLDELWFHSFACGVIGKEIAALLKMENPESLFLMGIVHDIGKMLLIKAIVDIHPEEAFDSEEMQLAIHEIHTTFGAALLKKMKFSKEFVQVAEFHHWNDFSKEDDRALVVLHLADFLSKAAGFGFQNMSEHPENDLDAMESLKSFKQLELQKEAVVSMLADIQEMIKESANAF